MARKTTVQLIDDLDEKPIADGDGETVTFTYREQSYEIDLSNKNLEALDKVMGKYIAAARKAGGSSAPSRRSAAAPKSRSSSAPKSGSSPASLSKDVDPKLVRQWAGQQGIDVNSRGRLSAELIGQYKAAGN